MTTVTRELPKLQDIGPRTCGLGVLTVMQAAKQVALPLAKVHVAARVADRVAHVTIEQTFQNPHTEHLEAVYIFPLGGAAAVSEFELHVGKRVIKGRVKEREAARAEYRQALEDGKRAALLEQERDDIFTVSVGNLPPGEEITVKLCYSARLPFFEDGRTELRLPLVVAPRYIPGGKTGEEPAGDGIEEDSDRVSDASRITPPRLAKGFDPKTGLKIEVELVDGDVDDLQCSQHALKLSTGKNGMKIGLSRQDELLNRDFILRWSLSAEKVRSTLLIHKGDEGKSFGMLSIIPPKREGYLGAARDVVFVLDRSGSMEGIKMASAARACSLLLATLGPRDHFAIQAFDDSVEWYQAARRSDCGTMAPGEREEAYWLTADDAGKEAGDKFLRTIDSRGGTELDGALADALRVINVRMNGKGRIPVVVLITDGQVGNESEILKRLQAKVGDARIFTIGIDTAVNETFLRHLAGAGGGTASFCVPGEALEDALRSVGREIGSPLIVDVSVEDISAGLDEKSQAPSRIPDLFEGRATTAFFTVKKAGKVRVKGTWADGKKFEAVVESRAIDLPAVGQLWARTRVADLEDRYRIDEPARDRIKKEIIKLAVEHTLLTRFTAFLAVDEKEIVNKGGEGRKVVQPVEMPDKWDMEMGGASHKKLQRQSYSTSAPGAGRGASSGRCEDLAEAEAPMPCKMPAPPPTPKSACRMPSPQEEDKTACEKAPDPVTPAEREEVFRALEALVDEFDSIKDALGRGKMPSSKALEKARTKLLAILSKSVLGPQLAELQKFLRTAAVELVAALNSEGVSAKWLVPLFEKHAAALDAARAESAALLSGSKKKGWKFWEKSV